MPTSMQSVDVSKAEEKAMDFRWSIHKELLCITCMSAPCHPAYNIWTVNSDDYLKDKTEDYQSCYVLYCVRQLCTVIRTHGQFLLLTVGLGFLWISVLCCFCHFVSMSLAFCSFFSTKPRDWLGRPSPNDLFCVKWISGTWNLNSVSHPTQSVNLCVCCAVSILFTAVEQIMAAYTCTSTTTSVLEDCILSVACMCYTKDIG